MSKLICSKTYPYPFIEFPIFIFNNGGQSDEGSAFWHEMLPEAKVVNNFDELISFASEDVSNRGVLIINGSTYTTLCRDLFLNLVSIGARASILRSYNGFYIDDYFDKYPLTTLIFDVAQRQVFQSSSQIILPPTDRSFWISSISIKRSAYDFVGDACSNLEGQFYPSLVVSSVPFPTSPNSGYILLVIIAIILFLAVIFWLVCLIV